MKMFTIYAVSDSIGETAGQVAKATASQFNAEEVEVKRVSYIKDEEDAQKFIYSIEEPENSMVISTIVLVGVRKKLTECCEEKNILINNVLGPCIDMASKILGKIPVYKPGAIWNMDSDYYKRIEAMEFAIEYDDSKDNRGIINADVVLIGLSRTSKTPLCMYLANKGIKAINVPLLPEIPLPEELKKINRRRIIGLTIDPMQLIEIRKHRLDKYRRMSVEIEYANAERVFEEIEYADRVMRRLNCVTVDITKRAIEDTALLVMDKMYK
jgi:regulator of PEP synthase PpsR (kinase-PPPase family)